MDQPGYGGDHNICNSHGTTLEQLAKFQVQLEINSTKLNWVIGIALTCLTAMGLLWFKVGAHAEVIATHSVTIEHIVSKMTEHEGEIHELKNQYRDQNTRLNLLSNGEQFVHGAGAELHHLDSRGSK